MKIKGVQYARAVYHTNLPLLLLFLGFPKSCSPVLGASPAKGNQDSGPSGCFLPFTYALPSDSCCRSAEQEENLMMSPDCPHPFWKPMIKRTGSAHF